MRIYIKDGKTYIRRGNENRVLAIDEYFISSSETPVAFDSNDYHGGGAIVSKSLYDAYIKALGLMNEYPHD